MPRFAALLALGLAACDGGAGSSCVLDSDCADFLEACIDGRCQPAGARTDGGGAGMDASAEPDAGPARDSGPPPSEDAGEADAGETDAGEIDAAVPVCATPPTDWTVTFVSADVPCGGAVASQTVTVTEDAAAPCTFVVTPVDAPPALEGTFTLSESGSVAGTLTPGAAAPTACTGTYVAEPPQLTFICGGGACVMGLNPT